MLITQTPLRVSFFGGGTDFKGFYQQEEGCVLSTAIDKYIFVTVKRRFDKKIRIGYTRTELVDRVDEVEHELVREALKITGVNEQIELNTMGDIPATGSGLGSSSSVSVGCLNALYSYLNCPVTLDTLARLACEIEIERICKPIGKQDQYIAAYGGFRFIRFLPDNQVQIESVDISPANLRFFSQHFLLFFTNSTRKSESILAEQNNNISLNFSALREMRDMAITARRLVETGQFDAFGRMLHDAWSMKKSLAKNISNPEINLMYEKACHAGAIGGKITGAGGGGFMLLYCPLEKQLAVRSALSAYQELPIAFEANGSKVIFSYP